MKKTKFTDEQIAFALQQHEAGTSVAEISRKLGIAEQTFYRWKKRFGGLAPSVNFVFFIENPPPFKGHFNENFGLPPNRWALIYFKLKHMRETNDEGEIYRGIQRRSGQTSDRTG